MGSLFRSEDMTLCQLYLQAESAYACVSELGELGIVQFKDLNTEVNAFHKRFVNEIRRCEEMERQLRYFEKEMKKEDLEAPQHDINPEAPAPRDMVDLEALFESTESQLKEVTNNIEALKRNYIELVELKQVLRMAQYFFQESVDYISDESIQRPDIELLDISEMSNRIHLDFVTGTMLRERVSGFMRLLWCACRGNAFFKFAEMTEDIEDINTGEPVKKVVFTVFFQGEQLKILVKKICEGFRATLYPCPDSGEERREMAHGIRTRLEDLNTVIAKSQEQRTRILNGISNNLSSWNVKVVKIKAIYHTLNMFSVEQKNFIGEGWCPVDEVDAIRSALQTASEQSKTSAPSLVNTLPSKSLPTYHRTNKFTNAFQVIIDAYGIASYKEVNPAPFAIITFPFLFSVMFGDIGHGILMFCLALWMVIRERQLEKWNRSNEMWVMLFGGRYLILLMSLFSIYSGFLYNDCFSKSFNLFGSKWRVPYDFKVIQGSQSLQLDPNNTSIYDGSPYPFGVDPVWQVAINKITFTNSYKKKMSVILGVFQMILGIFLSLFNHTYFRQPMNIFCVFLPQLLFLLAMFGYLNALIFTKWLVFTAGDANCAPSLLIGLINMFLFKRPTEPCSSASWYSGQETVEIFIVVLAGLCVPWMLLAKPLLLRHRQRRKAQPGTFEKLSEEVEDGKMASSRSTTSTTPPPPYEDVLRDRADTCDVLMSQAEASVNEGDELRLTTFVHLTNEPDELGRESSTDDVPPGTSAKSNSAEPSQAGSENEEPFDFNEVFLHQAIHTIEYCLGCISHTASYLRLWALSLAHAQLSEVLWTMVLHLGLSMPGYLGAFATVMLFTPWAALTIAILLVMEGLSAFLHTLRLHWVEFNSKFYMGDGFQFQPLSFEDILKESTE